MSSAIDQGDEQGSSAQNSPPSSPHSPAISDSFIAIGSPAFLPLVHGIPSGNATAPATTPSVAAAAPPSSPISPTASDSDSRTPSSTCNLDDVTNLSDISSLDHEDLSLAEYDLLPEALAFNRRSSTRSHDGTTATPPTVIHSASTPDSILGALDSGDRSGSSGFGARLQAQGPLAADDKDGTPEHNSVILSSTGSSFATLTCRRSTDGTAADSSASLESNLAFPRHDHGDFFMNAAHYTTLDSSAARSASPSSSSSSSSSAHQEAQRQQQQASLSEFWLASQRAGAARPLRADHEHEDDFARRIGLRNQWSQQASSSCAAEQSTSSDDDDDDYNEKLSPSSSQAQQPFRTTPADITADVGRERPAGTRALPTAQGLKFYTAVEAGVAGASIRLPLRVSVLVLVEQGTDQAGVATVVQATVRAIQESLLAAGIDRKVSALCPHTALPASNFPRIDYALTSTPVSSAQLAVYMYQYGSESEQDVPRTTQLLSQQARHSAFILCPVSRHGTSASLAPTLAKLLSPPGTVADAETCARPFLLPVLLPNANVDASANAPPRSTPSTATSSTAFSLPSHATEHTRATRDMLRYLETRNVDRSWTSVVRALAQLLPAAAANDDDDGGGDDGDGDGDGGDCKVRSAAAVRAHAHLLPPTATDLTEKVLPLKGLHLALQVAHRGDPAWAAAYAARDSGAPRSSTPDLERQLNGGKPDPPAAVAATAAGSAAARSKARSALVSTSQLGALLLLSYSLALLMSSGPLAFLHPEALAQRWLGTSLLSSSLSIPLTLSPASLSSSSLPSPGGSASAPITSVLELDMTSILPLSLAEVASKAAPPREVAVRVMERSLVRHRDAHALKHADADVDVEPDSAPRHRKRAKRNISCTARSSHSVRTVMSAPLHEASNDDAAIQKLTALLGLVRNGEDKVLGKVRYTKEVAIATAAGTLSDTRPDLLAYATPMLHDIVSALSAWQEHLHQAARVLYADLEIFTGQLASVYRAQAEAAATFAHNVRKLCDQWWTDYKASEAEREAWLADIAVSLSQNLDTALEAASDGTKIVQAAAKKLAEEGKVKWKESESQREYAKEQALEHLAKLQEAGDALGKEASRAAVQGAKRAKGWSEAFAMRAKERWAESLFEASEAAARAKERMQPLVADASVGARAVLLELKQATYTTFTSSSQEQQRSKRMLPNIASFKAHLRSRRISKGAMPRNLFESPSKKKAEKQRKAKSKSRGLKSWR
ncbi:hypothetical protein K437DRAFT_267169 [Tilletiaria anomala UBC 951]|uniref:Uncharacterized protein n=1 Tax=Tilletiaria anomala (strain ATCC 24038 / CBS 436.72 / UBC 951) TaxID=1037660 RepID=A0A066WCB2_TILAU|nr:uncharacterized protein K437DRAFT_267169 [Tilletiaria anomala UBC 951]KDN51351.1 hypothetical protein K437DRAFT_267169 [Tilletiaria anomala UBC 951]